VARPEQQHEHPGDIGDSRNQLRRLVPVTIEQGVIIALQNVFEEQSTGFSNYHAGTLRVESGFRQGTDVPDDVLVLESHVRQPRLARRRPGAFGAGAQTS